MDLRQLVLRAWSGGEPDQAAQGAALIGSHVLPFRRRQSGSARPAHLRLLADADPIPKQCDLAKAEFATLGLRLLKSPLASSKPPEPCAWPSRPVIPRRPSSPACPARSPRAAPDRRGIGPLPPSPSSNASSKSANLQAVKNPNDDPQPKSPRTKISGKAPLPVKRSG